MLCPVPIPVAYPKAQYPRVLTAQEIAATAAQAITARYPHD